MPGFGWRPSLPDQRDLIYPIEAVHAAPDIVDLQGHCPEVYDQGSLGSCTAFACTSALQIMHNILLLQDVPEFSELFHYYNERLMEGTVASDAGATIRDGFKVMHKYGVCSETAWPYDPSRFAMKPPRSVYSVARGDIIPTYARVRQRVQSIQAALANQHVVVAGFTVYESFMSEQVALTGEAPMPDISEAAVGGHAVVVVGYDRTLRKWKLRNSWGKSWGKGGYFTLPFEYLTRSDLSGDFWTIQTIQ